jgi:hypothetical protein
MRVFRVEGPHQRAGQPVEEADHHEFDPIGRGKACSRRRPRKLLQEGGDSRL